MNRYYFGSTLRDIASRSPEDILGHLVTAHAKDVEPKQRGAWTHQIERMSELATAFPDVQAMFEFVIPRMGKRADVVLLVGDVVVVLEYKVGAETYATADLEQALDYAVDLKNFHSASHDLRVVPILVATGAAHAEQDIEWYEDGVAHVVTCNDDSLGEVLGQVQALPEGALDAASWATAPYAPTPTIVEAARSLYQGHAVAEITRSEAGAHNLTTTATTVERLVDEAREQNRKVICFVTGVPGSGKTLAGLDIATRRQTEHEDENAVFLSGNGPLVKVLREALARDYAEQRKGTGEQVTMADARRRTHAFIQNIHHFRDDALASDHPPTERVAVFDEAQRAWDRKQASKFMRDKRGQSDFDMSEPEFLLSVMDRHEDWCAVVCLIGGGQEINTGEAGIEEWHRALADRFSHWKVAGPARLSEAASDAPQFDEFPNLHLRVSVRSFRAEKLADFVDHVLRGEASKARLIAGELTDYPLHITRDLGKARLWLRRVARGSERTGLLASSGALRLKPAGIYVKSKITPEHWFLNGAEDVRSSFALEDVASEFDVQGLELDWACVCWDANLRWQGGAWSHHRFRGTRWQNIKAADDRSFLSNSYRVLLTRARQGMVVYVPGGSDLDHTRDPAWYDELFAYLKECGFSPVSTRAS